MTYSYIQRRIKTAVRKQRRKESKILSQLTENLTSLATIQAFGREEYEIQRFDQQSRQNLAEGIRVVRLDAAMAQSVTIISAVEVSVVVFFGAWQALWANMTPGDVLLFSTYVRNLYKLIQKLARLLIKLAKTGVSAQRISNVLDVEPEIQDRPDAIEVRDFRGEIRFTHVSFGYEQEDGASQKILDDISFSADLGQRIALVGTSGGCGKIDCCQPPPRSLRPTAGRHPD